MSFVDCVRILRTIHNSPFQLYFSDPREFEGPHLCMWTGYSRADALQKIIVLEGIARVLDHAFTQGKLSYICVTAGNLCMTYF